MPVSARPREFLYAGALLALVGAVYARSLGVGFFSDDWEWLGRMNATLDRPSYVFTVFYRDFNPVLHASFVLDWLAGGGGAFAFHLHSFLLHLVCTALLFLLCLRLSKNAGLAAAAALVWALNVRLSEAVIWPAARGHELAAIFSLGALLAAGSRRRFAGALATGLFALGLLSKETALMPLLAFPFLLPDWRRARGTLLAMAAVGVGFIVFKILSTPAYHTTPASLGDVALKVPFVLLRPLGLGDFYPFTWEAAAGVFALFGLAAWAMRRTVALGGLLWVVASTLPIIPLDKLSSRYLYLPAIGWSIVLCGVVPRLSSRMQSALARRAAALAGIAAAGLLSATGGLTIQREIDDYAFLAAPYQALAAALAGPLASIQPGQSVVVIDAGPRDTIPRLAREQARRGTITKLIPYRAKAVEGLIELPDLMNAVTPRLPGVLARGIPAESAQGAGWIVWDGRRARSLPGPPRVEVPSNRLFAARRGV